jgi:endonuclease/exonuclease/phosphatase family metal-dependent hydrolase
MGDLNFRPDSDEYARLMGREDESTRDLRRARPVDAWARAGKGAGPTIGLEGKDTGRIDYVLVAPELAEGVTSARVDAETRASDHQPLFVELHLKPAK